MWRARGTARDRKGAAPMLAVRKTALCSGDARARDRTTVAVLPCNACQGVYASRHTTPCPGSPLFAWRHRKGMAPCSHGVWRRWASTSRGWQCANAVPTVACSAMEAHGPCTPPASASWGTGSHWLARLGAGALRGTIVRCPAHGWRYDVCTGQTLNEPDDGVARFLVQVVDGTSLVVIG